MIDPERSRPVLSPEGLARREAMLGELQVALRRRKRLRAAERISGFGVVGLLLCVHLLLKPNVSAPIPSPTPVSPLQVEFLSTAPLDPRILIGDDELLAILRAANMPSGLIRTPARVILTAEVADPLPRKPNQKG